MIQLDHASKSYGSKVVLRDICLNLNKGDVVGLLGPSGSGKSTILGLIAKAIQPDRGTCGTASDHIGYVFQDHRLLPWKTALENVLFALEATSNKSSQSNMRQRARKALTDVGLEKATHYFPKQLSGGMCQRVSIARAFAIKPDILLLDEPLSALDSSRRSSILADLKRMIRQRPDMAVVYVTHNRNELSDIVKYTYEISGGQLHLADKSI